MKINHGGLDVLVPQTVFDLDYVPAPGKQIHGPSVPEGVNRVDIYQTLGRKDFGQILSADTVYAVPGEFFSPLTDKDPVLVQGPGMAAVSVDIDLEKFCGFVFKIYEPEPIPLPEDGQVFFLRVEELQIQGGDLRCPGTRVKKEMKEGIVPEALLAPEIHCVKDLQDLVMVKKTDKPPLIALLGDIEDHVCQCPAVRTGKADHLGKGFQGRKTVIPGPGDIVALLFKVIEEGEDELRGEMLHSQGFHIDAVMLRGKGKKKLKHVPVGLDGIGTDPLEAGKVVTEELMNEGVELHSFLFCQREKSTRFLRLCASATRR
jgi:hypothetical protein